MISVVVPTYNERDNIRELLIRLSEAFSDTTRCVEIIIIDDNSPDGTAMIARSAGEELDLDVRVIVRTGHPDLSRSVVRGFREAQGDILVVMDADLQHPPETVPTLAKHVGQRTPIVVGTRYADNGRIENWPLLRRITSYGALTVSKIFVPPTRGVSDPISGFFAVCRDAFCVDDLSPEGYKILIELLATIDPDEISEVGFVFASRQKGETSLDLEQYYRFLRHAAVCGIRYRLTDLF